MNKHKVKNMQSMHAYQIIIKIFMIIQKKFHPTNIKKKLFGKYKNDKFII